MKEFFFVRNDVSAQANLLKQTVPGNWQLLTITNVQATRIRAPPLREATRFLASDLRKERKNAAHERTHISIGGYDSAYGL
jgi:hypothetical protein